MELLLVEDNRADVLLFSELLAEKDQTVTLHWVRDGEQALDYIFKRRQYETAPKPDVVLLDLGLPRISGYHVLKEMKADNRAEGISVVVLTTSTNPGDRLQCNALGADGFYSKPRSLDEYDSLLANLIKNAFHLNSKSTSPDA